MFELTLVEPTKDWEAPAMAYRQEYIDHGADNINGSAGFLRYGGYDEWLARVAGARDERTSYIGVPATTYFSVRKRDGRIVGTIQLRHRLTEDLERAGGHVGYGIRPTERRKGYATQQLALVVSKARELNIPRLMISCRKDNLGSARVAVNNGAVFTREGIDEEGGEIKIFWIDVL